MPSYPDELENVRGMHSSGLQVASDKFTECTGHVASSAAVAQMIASPPLGRAFPGSSEFRKVQELHSRGRRLCL